MSTRYISFSLSRSRPYPFKKPFPLGNEEGELLNLQIVFLVLGKLEKKFPWRLKALFALVGKVQLQWETFEKPLCEEWLGDGKIEPSLRDSFTFYINIFPSDVMLLPLHFWPESHVVLKLIIYLDPSEAFKCSVMQEAATKVSSLHNALWLREEF